MLRLIGRAIHLSVPPPLKRSLVMQASNRYIDIGINFTDEQYQGVYHGRKHHQADLASAISRAQSIGCQKFIITGSDLEESVKAIEIAKHYPGICYTTAGVHPCSVSSITKSPEGPQAYLQELKRVVEERKSNGAPIVAFGEIGLDYDRLHYTPREDQLQFFESQLEIACMLSPPLPLFLHSRAAADDFEGLLRKHLDRLPKRGVVHSFTGSIEEMQRLVEMGFDIGVNGCSLKTEESLEVVRQTPLERIQLETDGPWCEIRATHASSKHLEEARKRTPAELALKQWESVKKERWAEGKLVKGRNESCRIAEVAVLIAAVKGISVEQVCQHAWDNAMRMFQLA